MKVSIRKDGFVYVNDSKLVASEVLDIIREVVARDITEEIHIGWEDEVSSEDTRIKCVLGVNKYTLSYDASWYCSNFISVGQWKSEMEDMIGGIEAWYSELPVDEREIELKYTAIV